MVKDKEYKNHYGDVLTLSTNVIVISILYTNNCEPNIRLRPSNTGNTLLQLVAQQMLHCKLRFLFALITTSAQKVDTE